MYTYAGVPGWGFDIINILLFSEAVSVMRSLLYGSKNLLRAEPRIL